MHREHHKWYSSNLGREMELLVFGHGGAPVLVFPTSMGKYFEYADRGMVHALAGKIEESHLQLFCVDSVDGESWYNKSIHPVHRVQWHMQYERYVMEEVVPLIRLKNQDRRFVTTGCSFGGYHAMNFGLRHPDIVTDVVTMGGAFDIQQFLDGHYDDNCYFNSPTHYLRNLSDPWYYDSYRRMRIVLVTGEHDMCWDANEQLAAIFREKWIPHELHVWGNQTGHDWPWWQQMAPNYLP
jgi:esterase/lipase superfamily enzyme